MEIGSVIALGGLLLRIKTYLTVIDTGGNLKHKNLIIAHNYLDDAIKATNAKNAILYINLAMDNYTKALLSKDTFIKFSANYGIGMCNSFLNEEEIAIKYLKRCLDIENELYKKFVFKINISKGLAREAEGSGFFKGILYGTAAGGGVGLSAIDAFKIKSKAYITSEICNQYPNIKLRDNQGDISAMSSVYKIVDDIIKIKNNRV